MNRLWFVMAIATLTGCATNVPAPISTVPARDLSVAEVRTDAARFKGSQVRWGGVITQVENQASQTWIEIVSMTLQKNGKPLMESDSSGRFIASFTGFFDPIVYSKGRQLTVVGTLSGETTRPIGEYAYSFPIVSVSSFYLWPIEIEEPPRADYPPPWWYYDPWPFHHYSPWPFYPGPYPYRPYW